MSRDGGAAPLVSVIVPARNAQAFIAAAIASACAQTYPDLEVLVVDDGSRDRTAAIAAAMAECDSRVRLLRQEHRGVAAARNHAIANARGHYIAPLDADDVWLPHKIERQMQALQQNSGAGLAYCWSLDIDEHGRLTGGYYAHERPPSIRAALLFRNLVGCSSVPLIRRSSLEQVGLYQTRYAARGAQGCEDLDLYRQIAQRYEFVLVREFLVGYRQAPGRMSSDTLAMARSFQLALRDCRRRQPVIPRRVLRWSLARQCFVLHARARGYREYANAIALLLVSVCLDPRLVTEGDFYRLMRPGRRFGRGRASPSAPPAPATPPDVDAVDAERARHPTALFDLFSALYQRRLSFTQAVLEPGAAAPAASACPTAPATVDPVMEDPRA